MYLTPNEAEARLYLRYDIDAELMIGDVMIASDILDKMAPFKGVDLETGPIPDALLDFVALKAYVVGQDRTEGKTSSSIGQLSASYGWPQLSKNSKRLDALLAPYLEHRGLRS